MLQVRIQISGYPEYLASFACSLPTSWNVSKVPTSGFGWIEFSRNGEKLPMQGWKVHVSVAAHEAKRFAELVLPALLLFRAAFKVPDTEAGFVRLNSGDVGATQVGKIATIYPASDSIAKEIVEMLKTVWPKTDGPSVPTDLRVVGTNSVYLRFGAFRRDRVLVDDSGRHQLLLTTPIGESEPDIRSESALQPSWAGCPPVLCEATSSGGIEGLIGGKYLPLALLSKGAKGSVFLGMAVPSADPIIIKTAVRGVAGDERGYDACAKLKNESTILDKLGSLVQDFVPRKLQFAEFPEQSALILADSGAVTLDRLSRTDQLGALTATAVAIDSINQAGVVHRDIKLQNIALTSSKVTIIDFELSSHIGSREMPKGGTMGHIPPEGADDIATVAADRYAFGAMSAGIFLDCSPSNIPSGSGRLLGLLQCEGHQATIPIFRALLGSDAEARPDLTTSAEQLIQSTRTSKNTIDKKKRHCRVPRQWTLRAAIEGGDSSLDFSRPADCGMRWLNHHFEADFFCEGINIGTAGIVLGLSILQSQLGLQRYDDPIILGARHLASLELSNVAPGFFLGSAGVALALTVAACHASDELLLDAAERRLVHAMRTVTEHDLFFGSAGVLWAASLIHEMTATDWSKEVGEAMCIELLNAAQCENNVVVWPFVNQFERSTKPCLGAAHGTAGIAMALGRWASVSGHGAAASLSAESLLSIHNFGLVENSGQLKLRRRMGSNAVANPREWCHGVLGYLWCILLADQPMASLSHAVRWAVSTLEGAPPTSNPTLCHGMSGELELFRMLGGFPEHLETSITQRSLILDRLRVFHQKRNGRIVWGSENPRTITPDLWVGLLGPSVALALNANDSPHAMFSKQVLQNSREGAL